MPTASLPPHFLFLRFSCLHISFPSLIKSLRPWMCGSVSVPLTSVDDLLAAPGCGNLTQLDNHRIGKTTWFKHDNGKISKQIFKKLKSNILHSCAISRSLSTIMKSRRCF
ncbi:unnamed protein product [Microthlaspi erraticum]|uniref:Uncharacterized protein n=1 Tax=Microthlaspi erraticum TaxID=1685480 RepID=A0A6D2KV52_9BRAS|nr:unnamed protein product [Microthlaspi erraticum]